MAMKQAADFREVGDQLRDLLADLGPDDFSRVTLFKQWTVEEIVRHLHVWNKAAFLSLTDSAGFQDYMARVMGSVRSGNMRSFEADYLDGLSGVPLIDAWADFYPQMADAFAEADPKTRLPWAGPSMSARSSITARLMETWAHAQAIYDEHGIERQSTDAIENIVVLGLNTYGWTFRNRKLEPPEPVPQLVLTAPSGAVWTLGETTGGETAGEERIEGLAEQFCQVVTQCRNIADTSLTMTGANATHWMRIAQCFAGPPNDPPPPGARYRKRG